MDLNPVIVEFNAPKTPLGGWRDKLPKFGPRGTKILIAVVSAVMILSMISFAVFTLQSNNTEFSKKHGLDINAPQSSGSTASKASLPGAGVAVGIGGTSGQNAPEITLTAEPATVTQGGKSTLKWSVTNNPKSCVASDDWSGDKSLSGGSETTPALTQLQNYLFTLTCKTATGTGFKTVAVSVTPPPSSSKSAGGVPQVTIAAAPNNIFAGDTTSIVWSATNNPTSCTASGDWTGLKSASGSEKTAALTTARKYTYNLTCKNASGSSQAVSGYLTVQALPPGVPAVYLDITPASNITPGNDVTLTWRTENSPTSCSATGGTGTTWAGTKATNGGSQTFKLTSLGDYVFAISCTNGSDSRDDSASIRVIPNPPVVSLTASPSTIAASSGSTTLTWSATNSPTSCTASSSNGSWSGTKAASGTATIGSLAAGSYTFSLSCVNEGGTGYQNNVPLTVVNLPVTSISASPISVTVGGSSTLTWSATNSPTGCSASGDWSGAKTPNSSASTGALSTARTYSYNLSCSNAGGAGPTASATVSASSGGTSSPPGVTISASPTTVGVGSTTTITWSTTNSPTSCTASGAWSGTKSGGGSFVATISSAGTNTFTLTCSNSAGNGSGSVSVTGVALPTVNLSASPTSITAGGSTTLTWTTGNSPTSCTAGGAWSGSKNIAGASQAVTLSTVGSNILTLSCSNAGGTTTATTTVSVTAAAVYCGGLTPCYSTADLNTHTTSTNCWGYNTYPVGSTNKSVYNISGFNTGWHSPSTPKTNLLPGAGAVTALCGAKEISSYLSGTSISGVGSHNHQTSTKQNTNTTLVGYRQGYYDPAKP